MVEWKLIIGIIGGIIVVLSGLWALLDKFDKKGDKRAVAAKRLEDVEAKVNTDLPQAINRNAGEIKLLQNAFVKADKTQALQGQAQEATNQHLTDLKEMWFISFKKDQPKTTKQS